MLQKTQGVVLNSIKYSESSIITRIYTQEFGMLSFLVHGVRKSKSRMPASFFQPFTILQLDINYKPKSNLQNIKEVTQAQRTDGLHSDIRKTTIALFLAEILHKSLDEQQQDEGLFDFLQLSITFLDSIENSFAHFHLIFLIQLSKYLGFYPNLNMDSGNLKDTPYGGHFFDEKKSKHLKQIMNISYLDRNSIKLNNSDRKELLNDLIRYYQLHISGLGEIKSLRVLESLFD